MKQKGSEANPAAPARESRKLPSGDECLFDGLAELVARMDESSGAGEASRAFLESLVKSRAVSRGAIFIAGPRRRLLEFRGSLGVRDGLSFKPIDTDSAFARWLLRAGAPAAIDDFFAAGGAGNEDEAFLAPLVEAGFSSAAPLVSEGVLAGILACAFPRGAGAPDEAESKRGLFLRAASTVLAGTLVGREAARERRALERFAAVKGDSLDRACGDLRSPLRMLRSALSSLDSDDPADAILVDMARGAVSRLEETAAFARSLNGVDAASSPAPLEKIEIRSLVDDALREMIPELEEKELSISMTDDTAFRSVRVDREAMAAALRSVLSGVVAFSPRGGTVSVSLSVAIEGAVSGAGVEIAGPFGGREPLGGSAQSRGEPIAVVAIGSPGISLPCAGAASLADPFAFAEAAADERARSLGVGLGVARSVAVRHGGAVSVEYEPGGIARFTMRLPVAE